MQRIFLIIAVTVALAAVIFQFMSKPEPLATQAVDEGNTALVEITLPDTLSENAQIGKKVYEAKCVACHAPNGVGQINKAPPLVHKIYEPSHHGDESFQRAAALGVRSHHWPFGDMPPVENITRADVVYIVNYIRELQRANGIN